MAEPKDLVGTWRMLSWNKKAVSSDETVDAHGPNPVGYITYGADGRMHAIVVRRDRPAPETLPPTDTEKLRLFDSMLAYAGTYTLDDEKVIHHVDVNYLLESLIPLRALPALPHRATLALQIYGSKTCYRFERYQRLSSQLLSRSRPPAPKRGRRD